MTHVVEVNVTTLSFLGATRTVTGSKFLIETDAGHRVLVDCGLFQGFKERRLRNWAPFPVPPSSIDAILLTHAHIDHCGYIPRLVKMGFTGPVHATADTRRLAAIVLPDSGHLQEKEAEYANRKGYSKHKPALPLYTRQDAVDSLDQFRDVRFDEPTEIVEGLGATFRWAGHILGSASIDVDLKGPAGRRRVVFSGDLGRSTHPLLRPADPIGAADVVLTESTYGNREHPEQDVPEFLAELINRTAKRGGVIVIPSFAVDRTEVVLWHLEQLVRNGEVPNLPIFVDSPMATAALKVYEEAVRRGSPEIRPELVGTDLFSDLDLTAVRDVEQSKALNSRHGPMIIISASGMATGGRVLHHLAARMGDHRNLVLMVGFQVPGTRGDRLLRGEKQIKMLGRYFRVRAEVEKLELSAHADRDDLVAWVRSCQPPPETVYVVHGEEEASLALAETINEQLDVMAIVPELDEKVSLDG